MMTTGADESGGGSNTTNASVSTKTISPMMMIDEVYEFSAPRFYDFIKGETDEDMRKAELWFDTALTYAPSPFTQRVKTRRSVKVESLCDFSEAEQLQKAAESSDSASASCLSESDKTQTVVAPTEVRKADSIPETDANKDNELNQVDAITDVKNVSEECTKEIAQNTGKLRSVSSKIVEAIDGENHTTEAYNTPKPAMLCQKKGGVLTDSKKKQSARHTASLVKNPSVLKSKTHLLSSQVKSIKPSSVKKDSNLKKNDAGTCNFVHENQAIKRQKLDEGRSRQILNVKPPQPLAHKSKLGLTVSSNVGSSSVSWAQNKERKLYVREPAVTVPFVSTAEIMKKFQSSTRELYLPHSQDHATSGFQRKGKLTLTRPKEPELETSQRNRSVSVKSTAEIEEEMMAKIPKFKARPLNKKMLEAPSIPAVPRSTPQPPEFQEFHLETAARAHHNSDVASEISISTNASHHQNNQWKPHLLTTPKSPQLQTSLRARPPTVKSSWELEKEELEKIPKFKARPINRKIFESKGELGLQCHAKKHVTVPQEFHFATDERIPPPSAIANMFNKLSLNSEPRHDNPKPKNTMPNTFHFRTEERGAEKEKKFVTEIVQEKIEEEVARIRKANPYPYTTDFPVVPPKPVPKPCTKPAPFKLESLMRHEEEMQREREERERMEREEAQRRLFKAQPVLKDCFYRDPIPVPKNERKPLTQVQQFNLHADHRAVEREEFDKKVKEKEMQYKRYREESEAARMIEEEKALKQLRRTLVPHARPVPNFDRPFCPGRSSKEPTKAKSPKLRMPRRRERHNKIVVNAATSSAATNMR